MTDFGILVVNMKQSRLSMFLICSKLGDSAIDSPLQTLRLLRRA